MGILVVPPTTIFSLLCHQDKTLKVVTLEGSGSLFEPILFLTKGNNIESQLSILPTGSASGKEALNDSSVELALTSLSSENNNEAKEARLAEDPIVLVHKKNSNCQLFNQAKNLQSNNQNNTELVSQLFDANSCSNLVVFLREGGKDRSNLNKTILIQDKSLNNDLSLTIRELPENNFLAYEKFQRESYLDAVIFFPSSFVELNKELFSSYQTIKLNELNPSKKLDSPKLQKELNLIFKQAKTNEQQSNLRQIITNILLKTKELQKSLQLQPKSYCNSKESDNKCSQKPIKKQSLDAKEQDINEFFETKGHVSSR